MEMGLSTARHRFAALLALSTLVLVFVGGLVTSTGSAFPSPTGRSRTAC
jgi:hypothetical protein